MKRTVLVLVLMFLVWPVLIPSTAAQRISSPQPFAVGEWIRVGDGAAATTRMSDDNTELILDFQGQTFRLSRVSSGDYRSDRYYIESLSWAPGVASPTDSFNLHSPQTMADNRTFIRRPSSSNTPAPAPAPTAAAAGPSAEVMNTPLVKEIATNCASARAAAITWGLSQSGSLARFTTPASLDQDYLYAISKNRAESLQSKATWEKEGPSPFAAFYVCVANARIQQLDASLPPATVSVVPLTEVAKEIATTCSAERTAAIRFGVGQSRVDLANAMTADRLDEDYARAAARDRAATLENKAIWDKPPVNPLSAFHVCVANARLRQLGPAPAPANASAITPAPVTAAEAEARGRAIIAQLRPACEKDRAQQVSFQMGALQKSRADAEATIDRMADAYADSIARDPEGTLFRLRQESTGAGAFYSACLLGERIKQLK